jgi:serine/threonine protein kinase/tetratricopeptide (TPR) repeat protein
MTHEPIDEKEVFNSARRLAVLEERMAYVQQVCGHEPKALHRVQELLRVYDQESSFLESPAVALGTTPDAPAVTERPGTVIGPYKLLEQIGEGSFGVVFMAEQEKPLRRKVALKVLKPGMDTAQVVARFEQERQALALMDHPNIAQVHDGGATASGRPYFVMELVRGLPVTDYCDQARLPIPERLGLFVAVCRAVQHAHQKGVIHRDLKPSNVLVTVIDGRPVPKVIDFGIAKAAGGALADRTLATGFHQVVGTPLYMSPEQAELSGVDVDTRTDVYALGVLLYELLTGTTPFDAETLQRAAFDEVRRVIREQEPPTPSRRLSTLNAAAMTTLSERRGVEARRLAPLLRGELDWVVMRALEKDRNRRYESAGALAADIERYLADEPVAAGPPSAWYRLRKSARRHRTALVAAGAVAAALLSGTAVSSWQAARATAAAAAERQAHETAQRRLAQVEKANGILGAIFTDLNPQEEGKDGQPLRVLLGERLDRAAKELAGEAVGDPPVVAKLQATLGACLLHLGHAEKAIAVLTPARATFTATLGPGHADTLECTSDLAQAYWAAGKLDRAVPLCEDIVRRRRAALGPGHPATLESVNNLATAYQWAGKGAQAVRLYEDTLQQATATLGPENPGTLTAMSNLAVAYQAAGKVDSALPLLEEALKVQKATLGPEHVNTLTTRNNLAEAYREAGRPDRALALHGETLKLLRAKLGPDHPHALSSLNNLALTYQAAGTLDAALPRFEEALRRRRAKLGPEHADTLVSVGNLANAYAEAGRDADAVGLCRELLAVRRRTLPADDPRLAPTLLLLGRGLLGAGQAAEAEPVLRECLALKKGGGWTQAHARSLLGGALLGRQEYAAAEPLLLQGYAGMKGWEDFAGPLTAPERRRLAEAGDRIVRFYEATGQADQARAWREKLSPGVPGGPPP